MPLRDDLLNPIPGENPCGENLRYNPVYDKIKEARREEDDVPQGDWQYERKTADYPVVLKLAGEALATKSKDLQIAVWLTEALIKTESFAGLRAGLDLISGLIGNFWDCLYPEIDDGDLELRAAPLDWLGSRMDTTLRSLPITKSGYSWYQSREARLVGYEDESAEEEKREARAAAIAEGKITGEDWDKAFNSTPKGFYVNLESTLDGILESIDSLSALCGDKFGNDAPSFSPLKTTIEELRHSVHGLLQKKRESEPDDSSAGAEAPPEDAAPEESSSWAEEAPTAAAQPKVRPRGGPLAPEPVDKDDAYRRIISVAAFLRREDPYSTTPFLLLRGLRFGELRSAGSELDPNLLEAPPTEVRQSLKKAANDGDWQQVIEIAETAMGMPCGRGWLDLQRYVYRAAYEMSYTQIQAVIRAEVNALLADYPILRQAILLDDTPAANPETQSWLDEIAPVAAAAPAAAEEEPVYAPPPVVGERAYQMQEDGLQTPDAYELAQEAAQSGRQQEAIEIMMREAAAEKSGRGRFQRRLQLAHLCISMGYEQIAHPILEQITAEIDSRGLEGWEAAAFVAQPFSLLYQCLAKSKAAPELKQKIYDRICRLDPLQALACRR
ncbi:MAG: type VI secretion system protein TssA [Acidobacteria bacterium]|nr:type VI secretion system protein TssA [Acidobacteriota bacterium]